METISTGTRSAPEVSAALVTYDACEQCGSPVEHSQRYCVVCGSRRKHVSDPAARFLAGAASRSRPSAAVTRGRQGGRRRAGLGTALVIAVIPLAVALGLLVGRAGDGSNSKLLAALRAEKSQVINIGGGGTVAASASTTGGASHRKGSKRGGKAGKVLSSTRYGSFHSIAGITTPSKAQLSQNAQIVSRVQSQINSSYVNSQKNLPNQIAVP